ncbi:MAG: amidase [Pirellulaceae bacterium]|nr:amidase [Pirellulaceae bacterium]
MGNDRIHAFGDDLLADHDAVALADLVRRGEVSPLELTEAAIARVEKVNGALNAMQLARYERALAEAATKRKGLFAGVPTLMKDNTDLRGLPTGHGSRAVPGVPAAADGAFARQYLSQGFTVLGKTTMPEFGFNCTTEYQGKPPTRNPWHPGYSCGGSSGGAAALVAAGVVPIAQANDGGGSIRIPAACCGLVGLKPTRGRLVDGEVARTLPVKIIVEGVVTRTVRDTAHFFAGVEDYWRNPKLPPVGLVEGPAKRRLKIGLVMHSITGIPTCPETCAVVQRTAALLESLGHRVEEMPNPVAPSFAEDFADYWGFLALMVIRFGHYSFGKDFDPSQVDDLTRGLAARFRHRSWHLPRVLYRLQGTSRQHAKAMKDYDLVLSPVLGHVTPVLGYLSPEVPFPELFQRLTTYVSFTPINNANGSPAMALPMGAATNDLPIGVQFSAAHGDERTLLEIAYELEQATPWRRIADGQGEPRLGPSPSYVSDTSVQQR